MKCKILTNPEGQTPSPIKPRGSDPMIYISYEKGNRMNKKKTVTLATFVIVAFSCLLFTTCNFPITEDEDDLPLEEWVVSKVEYHPNFWAPYVEVFFSYKTHGSGYSKEGATDEWLSKLMSIPGLELGGCSFLRSVCNGMSKTKRRHT